MHNGEMKVVWNYEEVGELSPVQDKYKILVRRLQLLLRAHHWLHPMHFVLLNCSTKFYHCLLETRSLSYTSCQAQQKRCEVLGSWNFSTSGLATGVQGLTKSIHSTHHI